MKRKPFHLILFLVLSFNLNLSGQVTFIIDSIPDYTPPADFLYIAGDFNGWNPGDINHKLYKNDDGLWETILDGFPDGITLEFKFTRGGWGTVEKGPGGEEIANRSYTFGNDSTEHIIIYNWADAGGPGESTAAWNVSVMDENFYMPQLDRERRIWLYLPPGYDSTDMSYPVLYMHDGQNLFDEVTSFAGEWEVDETLNELASQGYQVPIVVGIDNGGIYRIDELTPYYNEEYEGGGQGDEYMAFVVETLKPHIDASYRTLPDRENTGIIGSSLGGLISTYGALKYQDVFSKSGPFSPAYWINYDSIWNFVAEAGMQDEIRFYQNTGQHEGDEYIGMMYMMEDSLKKAGFNQVASKVIIGGQHNEQTWRDDFAEAYLWLFVSYANNVEDIMSYKPLIIYPNPVKDRLLLKNIELAADDHVRIIDSSGRVVNEFTNTMITSEIVVNNLKSGSYILIVRKSGELFTGRFIKL